MNAALKLKASSYIPELAVLSEFGLDPISFTAESSIVTEK